MTVLFSPLQLVDLGEPAHSKGSESGCRSQETACRRVVTTCKERGRCEGGLEQPVCECEPGWSGLGCQVATVPTTLRASSFVKIALSFTPPPHLLTIQLRVKTQGAQDGLLVHVKTHDDDNALSIHVSFHPLYMFNIDFIYSFTYIFIFYIEILSFQLETVYLHRFLPIKLSICFHPSMT